MMKKIPGFMLGVACTVLVGALTVTALAVGGQVSFGSAGVSLYDDVQFQAGELYEAPNGQKVPSSIAYTDEAGGITNYLSIRQIAELLDADIEWNSKDRLVELAPSPQGTIIIGDGETETVIPSEDGAEPEQDDSFPFSPAENRTPAETAEVVRHQYQARYQSESDFSRTYSCDPEFGSYINVTVTNNNTSADTELIVNLSRDKTIGRDEAICPAIRVAPGETVTTTLKIDDAATRLTDDLNVNITHAEGGPYTIDTTVEVLQFD